MIEGTIKETETDSEKIYEYTTICKSGTHANVKIIRPVLDDEEYARRRREAEQELIRFAQGVIADGYDWKELVRLNAHKGGKALI